MQGLKKETISNAIHQLLQNSQVEIMQTLNNLINKGLVI